MGDTIIIETPVATVLEVSGKQGPQGVPGATGATGATGPAGPAGTGIETLTTKGDLLSRDDSAAIRVGIGSTGQVLKVSAQGLPTWANESGAVTSVNGQTGAVTVAAATHAVEHEAGEADEIQAMAALVNTEDVSLNGIYVPNANGTTSGGRLVYYKPGTRENTKLEYNVSLSGWYLIKNTVVQLSGQEEGATHPWTPQAWLDPRSPQVLPNGGTVTRAGLELLARRAADGTSNVATATTSFDGLMSSADKTKLNGIASGATANTASSATPSSLGTAAAGSATDYARADHVHSAEVSDSAFRVLGSTDATKKVAIEVDTNVPTGTTVTLTAPSSSGTLALAGAAPSAHAASHAAAGSDPLAPSDIGAQSIFTTDTADLTNGNATLTAARAKIIGTLNFDGSTRELDLPTSNNLVGDTFIIRRTSGISDVQIYATLSGGGNVRSLVGTITPSFPSTRQYVFIWSGSSWASDPIPVHTHPASEIDSGTLAHERGGLEADVSAYNGIVKISGGSTSAVTVTSAGEALLDDADAAAQRTTLGLGTAATAATGDFAAASHSHTASAISDSTTAGRALLTAADAAAQRTSLGLAAIAASGSASDLGSGTVPIARIPTGSTSTTVALGNHSHELTALAATGATNGHVLTANGSNGATFAALPASGVTGAASSASDVVGVSGSNITGVDAGSADRLVFWDDSANKLTYLEAGSGLSISGTTLTATASGGSKTYAVFTAEHNQPPSTAFATLDTRNSIAVLDFDAATDENAVFVGIMPEAASLGSGLIVRLHWMATSATSGNVRWGVQFERSNTDLDTDSFDTAVEATAATNGTSGIITTTAITVTTIDGITAGDVFRLRVSRNADDATNDTMTGDAELVAVEVRSAA